MSTSSPGLVGVAISTTGHEHRLSLLASSVSAWNTHLPPGSVVVVTVDGSADDLRRVTEVVDTSGPNGGVGGVAWRVGQRAQGAQEAEAAQPRLGVAVNKNTGIEALMDAGVEHLFLCDDDCWPLTKRAVSAHIRAPYAHSMVNWGGSRLRGRRPHQEWTWPRGVMLYATREVIASVGGMIEEFGAGGHEHVEWSRRIHQAGHTPVLFPSPDYALAQTGKGARLLWHAEDMRQRTETLAAHARRKKTLTTMNRPTGYWENAEKILARMDNNPHFVPYTAADNQRGPATLQTRAESGEKQ